MNPVKAFLFAILLTTVSLTACGGGKTAPSEKKVASSTGAAPIDSGLTPPAKVDLEQFPKWGYIDKKGKFVIKPQFDDARPFSEGLAAVQKSGLWGFINPTGKLVIPYGFGDAGQFRKGFVPVAFASKWGFANQQGNVVVPTNFREVKPFSEHLAAVRADNTWGYIDERGVTVIPSSFQDAGQFSDDLAPVKVGEKWGFINEKGTMIIKPGYASARPFRDGIASVTTLPNKDVDPHLPSFDGVLDKNGILTIITPMQIRELFFEGLALYEHHNHWGYIDQYGNKVIKAHFDWADNFSDQLACVRKGPLKGYIDHTGKFVFQERFEDAQIFSEGLAAVKAKPEEAEEQAAPESENKTTTDATDIKGSSKPQTDDKASPAKAKPEAANR